MKHTRIWVNNTYWFIDPDSKVHGANMGPTWVLSAPDGTHVGPMNLAIRGGLYYDKAQKLVCIFHRILSVINSRIGDHAPMAWAPWTRVWLCRNGRLASLLTIDWWLMVDMVALTHSTQTGSCLADSEAHSNWSIPNNFCFLVYLPFSFKSVWFYGVPWRRLLNFIR